MPWDIAGVIDNGIPLPALERAEAVVAIALVEPEVGKEFVVGATAVEQLDLVSATQGLAHHVRADEAGPAENEDSHGRDRFDSRAFLLGRFRGAARRNGGGTEKTRLEKTTAVVVHERLRLFLSL